MAVTLDLDFDHLRLGVDGLDDQAGVRLAVADGLALIGLGFVLVDADLLPEPLLLDLALDRGALDVGIADLGGFPTEEEDLVEGDVLADLGVELLDVDVVADGDGDLLAAGFDDSVHWFYISSFALGF